MVYILILRLMKQLLPYLSTSGVFAMSQMQSDPSSDVTLIQSNIMKIKYNTYNFLDFDIDYTDTSQSGSCFASNYCNLNNICNDTSSCKYCFSGNKNSFPIITLLSEKEDPSCFLQVRQDDTWRIGSANKISIKAFTDFYPTNLLYADDLAIKGIKYRITEVNDLGYSFFSASVNNDKSSTNFLNTTLLPLTDKYPVRSAGYDPACDIFYYVDDFALWMVKNASQGANPTNRMLVRKFPRNSIVAADIDFSKRDMKLVYFMTNETNNQQIFRTDFSISELKLVANLSLLDVLTTKILKVDGKNNRLYVSSGNYLAYVDWNDPSNISIQYCDTLYTILNFAISDFIYYSCANSRRMYRMNPRTFCEANAFTYLIFQSSPLIVINNDIVHSAESCSRENLSINPSDLPIWFPYVVGVGAGLFLIILIIIIACVCYKCKTANINARAPPLPTGFHGLNYDDKVYENPYTDLETFEPTPEPTLPAMRSAAVYFDLFSSAKNILPNPDVDIPPPDYENPAIVLKTRLRPNIYGLKF